MQQKRLEVELPQTYRVYYPHVSKKLFALCNLLIRVRSYALGQAIGYNIDYEPT